MRIPILALLAAVLPGCWFGDPAAYRGVSLRLSETPKQVRKAEIKDALRLVDGVMAGHGVYRDPAAVAPDVKRVEYHVSGATGERILGIGPAVFVRSGRLEIGFYEFPAKRSSPYARKVTNEIGLVLRNRFGEESVELSD